MLEGRLKDEVNQYIADVRDSLQKMKAKEEQFLFELEKKKQRTKAWDSESYKLRESCKQLENKIKEKLQSDEKKSYQSNKTSNEK